MTDEAHHLWNASPAVGCREKSAKEMYPGEGRHSSVRQDMVMDPLVHQSQPLAMADQAWLTDHRAFNRIPLLNLVSCPYHKRLCMCSTGKTACYTPKHISASRVYQSAFGPRIVREKEDVPPILEMRVPSLDA